MKPTSPKRSSPDTKAQPAAGRGIAAKTEPRQQAGSDQPDTHEDDAGESNLQLPHERDQASDMTSGETSPLMEQARRDEADGLKDTSKAVELDRAYKKLRQ